MSSKSAGYLLIIRTKEQELIRTRSCGSLEEAIRKRIQAIEEWRECQHFDIYKLVQSCEKIPTFEIKIEDSDETE